MRVAGDDEVHIRADVLGHSLVSLVGRIDLKRLVVRQPIFQGATQGFVRPHAGDPTGQSIPDQLPGAQSVVAPRRPRATVLVGLLCCEQQLVGALAACRRRAPHSLSEIRTEQLICTERSLGRGSSSGKPVGGQALVDFLASAHAHADDREEAVDLRDLGRIEGQQHARRRLRFGLEQIDPGELALHLVHHVLDHLGAGVWLPLGRIERASRVQAARGLGKVFVAVVVPRVDFVAVGAEDAGVADETRVPGAHGRELDARSRGQIIPRKPLEYGSLDHGECELYVVIADDEDERAVRLGHELGKRVPDRQERLVLEDPLQHRDCVRDRDVASDVLGERVDDIAVEQERDAAFRTLVADPPHESREPLTLAQDLVTGPTAHVQVGHDVKFIVLRQVHTALPLVSLPRKAASESAWHAAQEQIGISPLTRDDCHDDFGSVTTPAQAPELRIITQTSPGFSQL